MLGKYVFMDFIKCRLCRHTQEVLKALGGWSKGTKVAFKIPEYSVVGWFRKRTSRM